MKRNIAHVTLAALTGAGLTYLALTAAPLRAQTLGQRFSTVDTAEASWTMPRYAQRHGQGWGRANRWDTDGRWGQCPLYTGTYDPSSLETLRGRVVSVHQYGQGAWIQVQTEQDIWEVHLAPTWYLERQGVEIAPNDTIEVTGMSSAVSGRLTLFASEMKLGATILQLRNDTGYPLWMNPQ